MAVNPSTVGLFNLALAHLGGDQLITVDSTWEQSALGILCLNNFPGVLDQALEAHPWSFAKARKVLAEIQGPAAPGPLNSAYLPDTAVGLRRRYRLPADCLRPVEIAGGWSFILEGRDILTNAAPAELIFIRRVEDPREWPPVFRAALAWGLAAILAIARNNDQRQQQMCLQAYQMNLKEAMARDNNMQQPAEELSDWERARLGMAQR
jgi:hypothetical protein